MATHQVGEEDFEMLNLSGEYPFSYSTFPIHAKTIYTAIFKACENDFFQTKDSSRHPGSITYKITCRDCDDSSSQRRCAQVIEVLYCIIPIFSFKT